MTVLELAVVGLIAACVIFVCSCLLRPTQVYRLWGVVIVGLVMWPDEELGRVGIGNGFPLEYLPLFLIMACGMGSAIVRNWTDLRLTPGILLLATLAVLAYGLVSYTWTLDRTRWLTQFGLLGVYFTWLHLMVISLRKEGIAEVLRLLEWIVYATTLFAAIGCVRVFITPGRYLGDFTPVIYYRSSEVIAVYSMASVAVTLYAMRGRIELLVCSIILFGSVFMTFSRTGMVGHVVCCGALFAFSYACSGRAGQRLRMTFVGVALGCVLMLALLAVVKTNTLEALTERAQSIDLAFEIMTGELEVREDDGGRRSTLLWNAWELFLMNPIRGVGMGGYHEGITLITNDPYLWARSHNFYYSYLAEFGLLGFVPLFGMVVFFPWYAWRTMRQVEHPALKLICVGFAAGWGPVLLMMVAQEFITAPYIWFYWGLGMAYLVCVRDYVNCLRNVGGDGSGGRTEILAGNS